MAIQERVIEYDCEGTVCEGLLAWDDALGGSRPGVLVAHAWGGRSGFEDDKARWLAAQGYVGFSLDVYGKGQRGSNAEENGALMQPLLDDRGLLRRRLLRALEVMASQEEVAGASCAGMGYCFGGLCMLDMARAGAEMAGVISIHGLFNAPDLECGPYKASILALHGYDDPMAPPQSVLDLGTELTAAGADWQLHAYGGTMHAFTNPEANDPGFGTVYSARADARATQAIVNFLDEVLGG